MTAVTQQRHTGGAGVICHRLVHLYGGQVAALRGVDLAVHPGQMIALLGPSGAGKSTLLSILAGVVRPTSGHALIDGRDLAQLDPRGIRQLRRRDLAVVPQDVGQLLLPYATARDSVRAALRSRPERHNTPAPEALLDQLRLGAVADRQTRHMSGGEQTRTAIAAAAARQPRLLLADEPSNGLDSHARALVTDLLRQINREHGTTIVVVTHDDELAAAMDRTVTIRDGRVGAEGRAGEDFAVIAGDGSLQLPQAALQAFPPGSLLRVSATEAGIDLRPVQDQP